MGSCSSEAKKLNRLATSVQLNSHSLQNRVAYSKHLELRKDLVDLGEKTYW